MAKQAKQAVELSDLERLRASRDLLWRTLQDAEPGQVAGLNKEYRLTLAELASMAVPAKESKLDELANRRAARRAGAPDRAPSAPRSQSRRSNGSHRTG